MKKLIKMGLSEWESFGEVYKTVHVHSRSKIVSLVGLCDVQPARRLDILHCFLCGHVERFFPAQEVTVGRLEDGVSEYLLVCGTRERDSH